jgi:proteasome activator subunit 4
VFNFNFFSLTTIYPTDYHSLAEGFDRSLAEYLPIKDWGKPGDVNNLQMKWHLPSLEERLFAEQLLHRFLHQNLNKLDDHVDQEETLPREELQRTLSHILDCILGIRDLRHLFKIFSALILLVFYIGSGAMLPPWQEEPINVVESAVTLTLPLKFSHSDAQSWHISFRNGQQIRLTIAQTVKIKRNL